MVANELPDVSLQTSFITNVFIFEILPGTAGAP